MTMGLRGTLLLLATLVAACTLAAPTAFAGNAGDEYVLDLPPKADGDSPSDTTGTDPAAPTATDPSVATDPATTVPATTDASAGDGDGSVATGSGAGGSGSGGSGPGGSGGDASSGGDGDSVGTIASVDFGKTDSASVPDIAAGAGGDGGVPLLAGALIAIAAAGGFAAWRRRQRASADAQA